MVNFTHQSGRRLADFWLPVMESARQGFGTARVEDPTQVGSELRLALEKAAARARDHGFDSGDIDNAMFAVVAWIDEEAMTSDWPGARAWRLAPLQRHYFSTTRAGVQFFERLDALPDEAHAVREVYGLVLIAGFRGHYGISQQSELAGYRRNLLERLQADGMMQGMSVDLPLFPGTKPGNYEARRYSRGLRPAMESMLILLGPLVLLVVMYIVLDLSLAFKVAGLLDGS